MLRAFRLLDIWKECGMARAILRGRIYDSPYATELFDAHIEALYEQPRARGATDLILDLEVFRPKSQGEMILIDDQPYEVVSGEYVPMRLRFSRGSWLWRTGPFERFEQLSRFHDARRLFAIMHQAQPDIGDFYLAATATSESGMLCWRAQGCELVDRSGERRSIDIVRRCAATPPYTTGAVPHRPALYHRFGGDPITIHLGRRTLKHRLFIGGLHHQRGVRPAVDGVLNLCGIEGPWVTSAGWRADDRFTHKGEGIVGMSAPELLEEARWVVERLRAGRRVLVHCFAGYNRSATVCCAALMLLEGVSAEDALDRVRERHPVAWPDPYHWFALKYIGANQQALNQADAGAERGQHGAPLLREVGSVQ